jgi:hypothetical protein
MEKLINDKGRWKRLEIKQREVEPITGEAANDDDE